MSTSTKPIQALQDVIWTQRKASLRGGKLFGRIVMLLLGSLLSAGLIAFGSAGLVHSYAHVSLQHALGHVGSAIERVANVWTDSPCAWGVTLVGLVVAAGVAFMGLKTHYDRKPQLTDELQGQFTDFNKSALGKLEISEKEKMGWRGIKKGHYALCPHEAESYIVVRTNLIKGELQFSQLYNDPNNTQIFFTRLNEADFKQMLF